MLCETRFDERVYSKARRMLPVNLISELIDELLPAGDAMIAVPTTLRRSRLLRACWRASNKCSHISGALKQERNCASLATEQRQDVAFCSAPGDSPFSPRLPLCAARRREKKHTIYKKRLSAIHTLPKLYGDREEKFVDGIQVAVSDAGVMASVVPMGAPRTTFAQAGTAWLAVSCSALTGNVALLHRNQDGEGYRSLKNFTI